jgi:hypothetical protein
MVSRLETHQGRQQAEAAPKLAGDGLRGWMLTIVMYYRVIYLPLIMFHAWINEDRW